jgi:hypothetical protein
MLAWMYLIPLLLFIVLKGRDYYLAATYPMLYAVGAVQAEPWLGSLRRSVTWAVQALLWVALTVDIAIAAAFTLPIAPVNSRWFVIANKLNGDFREEIGWPEIVETVARIRDNFPANDRRHLAILGTNYGEAGAVNLYGQQYGLPRAISGVNSFWYQGYGDPPPEVVIVLGLPRSYLETKFESCQVAGAHLEQLWWLQRRNRVASRHFRLSQAAPKLAGILEKFPILRMR